MNYQRRAKYLERAALREAKREVFRRDGKPLTRDELLELRIQSVEPWKRILLSVIGAIALTFGSLITVKCNGPEYVGGLVVALLGLAAFLNGLFGRRRTVEECLRQVGEALTNNVIEFLCQALD